MLPEPCEVHGRTLKRGEHSAARDPAPLPPLIQIASEANDLARCGPLVRRAMDVVKRELQRKRLLLEADFGGRKLLRRAEIERREVERIRSRPAVSPSAPAASAGVATGPSQAEHRRDEDKEALPSEEVIRRLRLLRQPATLFGEDDAARLRRLHAVLEHPAALADVDAGDIGEGQTNDFLRDIQALQAKVAGKPKPSAAERRALEDGDEAREVPFEELCDEDKIMAFFRRLMSEWSQEMDEMPEAERRTAKGKAAMATCKQCARYLEPLFKLCKNKFLVV
ncbi:hypothetical protein GUJ93_ZPchr0013g35189 [Zizania palustris]|uniref:Pre-mRNA processing factor 4 (PRP4)-like domain-containing protein n=1 Tax=Zizania palustris TaxID=103762 RepID=A0A8J5WVG7_ZIZPA|nr:hypothetical protein GUJ93_ZPchr0013g35189 [Zizania palustris]